MAGAAAEGVPGMGGRVTRTTTKTAVDAIKKPDKPSQEAGAFRLYYKRLPPETLVAELAFPEEFALLNTLWDKDKFTTHPLAADWIVRATRVVDGVVDGVEKFMGVAILSDLARLAWNDVLARTPPVPASKRVEEATRFALCHGAPSDVRVVVSADGKVATGSPSGLYLHWLASVGAPANAPSAALKSEARGVGDAMLTDITDRFAVAGLYKYVSLIIEYDAASKDDLWLEAYYVKRCFDPVLSGPCVTEGGLIERASDKTRMMRRMIAERIGAKALEGNVTARSIAVRCVQAHVCVVIDLVGAIARHATDDMPAATKDITAEYLVQGAVINALKDVRAALLPVGISPTAIYVHTGAPPPSKARAAAGAPTYKALLETYTGWRRYALGAIVYERLAPAARSVFVNNAKQAIYRASDREHILLISATPSGAAARAPPPAARLPSLDRRLGEIYGTLARLLEGVSLDRTIFVVYAPSVYDGAIAAAAAAADASIGTAAPPTPGEVHAALARTLVRAMQVTGYTRAIGGTREDRVSTLPLNLLVVPTVAGRSPNVLTHVARTAPRGVNFADLDPKTLVAAT